MKKTAMQQAVEALTLKAHNYELESVKPIYNNYDKIKIKAKANKIYMIINYLAQLRDTVEKQQIIDAYNQGTIDNVVLEKPNGQKYYNEIYENR